MTDWADEIAASLIHEGSSEGYDGCFNYFNEASEGEIAAALRKAKAEGVELAASMFMKAYTEHDTTDNEYWIAEVIHEARLLKENS